MPNVGCIPAYATFVQRQLLPGLPGVSVSEKLYAS